MRLKEAIKKKEQLMDNILLPGVCVGYPSMAVAKDNVPLDTESK